MQSEDPGYPQIIRGCQGETATGYHSPRPWGHYGYPAGHVVVSGPGLPDIDDGPVAAPLRSGGVSMHDFGPSAGFEDVDF